MRLALLLALPLVLIALWKVLPIWYRVTTDFPDSRRFGKAFMIQDEYPFRRGNGYRILIRGHHIQFGWFRKNPNFDPLTQIGGKSLDTNPSDIRKWRGHTKEAEEDHSGEASGDPVEAG